MNLDTNVLIRLLPEKRWYGDRGRRLTSIDIIDQARIDDAEPALVLALARLGFADGGSHIYHLPLLVGADGSVRDALDEVDRLGLVGELMASGSSVKGSAGTFVFGGAGLDPLASPPGTASIRALGSEQSNSSVVLDEDVIVKLFRRVEPGPNPDLELNRLLTNEGFPNIPPQVGEIVYEAADPAGYPSTDLAIAQRFIGDGRDGWQEFLAHLHRFYDAVPDELESVALEGLVEEHARASLDALEELGDITASLHVFLRREDFDASFTGEPVDGQDLKEWSERARNALAELTRASDEIPGLAGLEPAIEASIERLGSCEDPGAKIRIHGDYHLGQVMLSGRGWMIIDFEGEPKRPLEDRRARESPLKDVAGMLRSFSYASWAALFERYEPDSNEWQRLEPLALAWERSARDRFLTAYLRTAHEGRFLPPDRDTLLVLLDFFEIDKALYELEYERSHRPQWIRIPVRGLAEAVGRRDRR